MHPNQQEKVTPWYKEPFMVLILGIPLTAVIVGMIMLYNAVSGKDSLISDSYYKDGRMYTQNKTAINQAKSEMIGAQLLSNDDAGISLSISGNLKQQPTILKAKFIHPTLDTLDQEVLLQQFPDGTYKGASEASYKKWTEALRKVGDSPEWAKTMKERGLAPFNKVGGNFQSYVDQVIGEVRTLSKEIGVIQ